MTLHPEPLPLARRFLPIEGSGPIEYDPLVAAAAYRYRSIDWDALLGRLGFATPPARNGTRCAIILGPAGSGKSTELRLVAKRPSTFLVELDGLHDEEDFIDLVDGDAFETWCAGEDLGLFLLDAADQALRRDQRGLRRALRAVRTALGERHARARFVITSRPHEWEVYSDPRQICRALGLPDPGAGPPEDDPVVVRLRILPLDLQAVVRLGERAGVADLEAFERALRRVGGASLVPWPLHALQLATHWKTHGRLGRTEERLAGFVREALAERNPEQSRSAMPPEEAERAVRRLAAAAALGPTTFIALPGGLPDPNHPAIDAQQLFTAWDPNRLPWLLSCALFDHGSHSTVRFQRSEAVEYLAARWLLERHSQTSIQALEVLSTSIDGEWIIPRSRRGLAAWLAPHLPQLRVFLALHAPEALLFHGAPYRIPRPEIARALRVWCERNGDRAFPLERPDLAALGSLAACGIADTIAELLRTLPSTARAAREVLLALVEHGEVAACADVALEIALDTSEPHETRVCAAEAIAAVGSDRHRLALWRGLARSPASDGLLAASMLAAYPGQMSVNDVLATFARMRLDSSDRSDWLQYSLVNHLANSTPRLDLPRLSRGLLVLMVLGSRTRTSEGPVCTGRARWLADLCAELATRAIREGLVRMPLLPLWVALIEFLDRSVQHDHRRSDEMKALTDPVREGPEALRRQLFGRMMHRYAGTPWRLLHIGQDGIIEFRRADISWMAAEACSTLTEPGDRLAIAQSLASLLEVSSVDDVALRCAIESSFPELDLSTRLDPAAREARDRETEARRAEQRAQQQAAAARERDDLRQSLIAWKGSLAEGNVGRLARLLTYLDARGHAAGIRDKELDVESLAGYLGGDLAGAVVEGLCIAWRNYAPLLPLPTDNRVDTCATTCLRGLSLAVARGLDLSSLEGEAARLACRHAAHSLNRLPSWFADLLDAHPEVCRDWIRMFLDIEWSSTSPSRLLRWALYADERVADAITRIALSKLESEAPVNEDSARNVTSLLLRSQHLDRDRLRTVFQQLTLATAEAPAGPTFPQWARGWLYVDAPAFCDWIESRLVDRQHVEAALRLSSELEEDFEAPLAHGLSSLASIAALVRMMFRIAPPEEDPDHGDQVYSPGPRDKAADLRGRLVAILRREPTLESHRTLQALKVDPALAAYEQYFGMCIEDHKFVLAEAQLPKWTEEEIVACEMRGIREPATSEELFRVVHRHLKEIAARIENGDHSYRGLISPNAQESDFAKWVADQLDFKWGHVYNVNREGQVIDDLRTDITIEVPGVARVTVEAKRLHPSGWTIGQLVRAIEEQLIGRYMRREDARHGILLLGHLQRRSAGWALPGTNEMVNYEGLLEYLGAEATRIAAQRAEVDDVAVIGVDLCGSTAA